MSSNTTTQPSNSTVTSSNLRTKNLSTRSPNATSLNKDSNLSDADRLQKSDENIKNAKPFPLANKWTFYYDRFVANASPEEYGENLKIVATVNTVQMFWNIYNNIEGPEALQLRSSLHFMKNGIRPVWEDPHNENGGAWSFRMDKSRTADAWRELLMLCIGEQFEECVENDDDIYGLSVSSRFNTDIFTVWNKNANAPDKEKIMKKLTHVLKPIDIQSPYYKAHKEHADFKKKDGQTTTSSNRRENKK